MADSELRPIAAWRSCEQPAQHEWTVPPYLNWAEYAGREVGKIALTARDPYLPDAYQLELCSMLADRLKRPTYYLDNCSPREKWTLTFDARSVVWETEPNLPLLGGEHAAFELVLWKTKDDDGRHTVHALMRDVFRPTKAVQEDSPSWVRNDLSYKIVLFFCTENDEIEVLASGRRNPDDYHSVLFRFEIDNDTDTISWLEATTPVKFRLLAADKKGRIMYHCRSRAPVPLGFLAARQDFMSRLRQCAYYRARTLRRDDLRKQPIATGDAFLLEQDQVEQLDFLEFKDLSEQFKLALEVLKDAIVRMQLTIKAADLLNAVGGRIPVQNVDDACACISAGHLDGKLMLDGWPRGKVDRVIRLTEDFVRETLRTMDHLQNIVESYGRCTEVLNCWAGEHRKGERSKWAETCAEKAGVAQDRIDGYQRRCLKLLRGCYLLEVRWYAKQGRQLDPRYWNITDILLTEEGKGIRPKSWAGRQT